MIQFLCLLTFLSLICGCKSTDRDMANLNIIDGDVSNSMFVGMIRYDNGQACTGSLITPNFVLTAAHCVIDPSRLNDVARKCESPTNAYFTGRIRSAKFHLNGNVVDLNYGWSFGTDIGDRDVGLMRLDSNLFLPLHNGKAKYRIELHQSPIADVNQYAVGFGCTRTYYDSKCATYYGDANSAGTRRSTSVKNGFYQGCPGDSGGPVFNMHYTDERRTDLVVGIFGVISYYDGDLSDEDRRSQKTGSFYAKPKSFESRILDILKNN